MANNPPNPNLPDKSPPQSIEAEQSLLGCLMIDRNAIIKVVDFIGSRDFYRKAHQDIYKVCQELFAKDEPIDLLNVSSRLKDKNLLEETGGHTYLTELVNSVPTASHVLSYAKAVQRKRILRDLIEVGSEVAGMGYNETEDPDVLLDQAEKQVFSIAQKGLSQNFIPVKTTLADAFERIDKLSKHKGGLRGLPTGFTALDNMLAGLQKSDLIILASRPSLGKSAMAANIASYVAINEKVPVGIFSLEMSKDQLVDRLIADQASIDLWRLRTGKLSSDGENNDFTRIQQAMGTLSEAPIYIDDAAVSNILQMRAMTRRLQAEKGLGLIIVDYLQLMEPRDTNTTMVQQMTEVSRSLKSLARELNVPVLALSQLSRAVEQRSPQIPRLSDLRESGCLTGDTLITRADTGERVPIESLVGQTNIPVYSLDKDWKIKEMKISKVFSNGKKMIYELKTKSGFKIKASANHPFRKLESWCHLDQLSPGDFIAIPRKLSPLSPKNELSEKEIILLAHLLGDGCVLPNQPVHYTSSDLKNVKIVAQSAKELFQIKPRLVRQKNWWHVYLSSPYHLTHRKHHPIINWYSDLNIKPVRSWEKEIPDKIFSLDEENLCLFLKHLWATDGNISNRNLKRRKPSVTIYYATTSEKLAQSLKHLLLKLGIRSRISAVKKLNYRLCYHIAIQGKEDQLQFLTKIGCYGERGENITGFIRKLHEINSNPNVDVVPKEIWGKITLTKDNQGISWRDFAETYGMSYCGSTLFNNGVSRQRLTKILDFLPSVEIQNLAESDVFWDEIISIKPLRAEEVFDATVPGTHNFVANDFIVHNSIEQDADVVLFIYREDRYRTESSRQNIADIIIAKHRNGPVGKVELYFDDSRVAFRNLEKEYQEEQVLTQ